MNLPNSPETVNTIIETNQELNPSPDLPIKEESKKIIKPEYRILTIVLVSFLAFFSLGLFIFSKYYSSDMNIFNQTKKVTESPEPPSERARVNEYNHVPIDTKPQPYKVIIDPADPQPGEIVKLSVYINNSTPIISASAMLETDTDSLEKPLILSYGDNSSGVWTASWKIESSYNNTFHFVMFITDDAETYDGVVAIK